MGLNIPFVIHIPYGKIIQKCKNSNFPPAPAGIVSRRRAVFMSEDKVHPYQPIPSGINLTGSLYIMLQCCYMVLHRYVGVICYYFQVFSSSHFLSVNASCSLSITVPLLLLSCPLSALQRTIFTLWDVGAGRITCDDIIMTLTFCSFW